MKHFYRIFICLLIFSSVTAAEYIIQPFKDKALRFTKPGGGEEIKLFMTTFDHLTLNSDWSRGRGKATGVSNVNLALRGLPGFDTKTAYKAEPDEDLKYPASGNVNPHAGTVIFWMAGLDHNPGDRFTNGKKRTNIALSELRFGDGKEHISIKIYEYNGTLCALWSSSAAPEVKGLSAIAVCETRIDFMRNQWFRVAVSWNSGHLALYVNGNLRKRVSMPSKIALTSKLRIKNEDSFIGVRSKFYDDDHRWAVGIDDYMILKRPLTDIEIANYYHKLIKGSTGQARVFNVNFNGVDTGAKKIERLEAVFDLSGLNRDERQKLNSGKLPIECTLIAPDGKVISSGKINIRTTNAAHIFNKVDKPGKYTLKVKVGKHTGKFTVNRPDFSFLGNKIGEENTVPEIFKGFSVKGRRVNLWNRVYHFGNGPLPEKIEVFGQSLLVKAPVISIDKRKFVWTAGKASVTPTCVTYTGSGKSSDCTIDYTTTVEYDGLINLAFTINGRPVVSRMSIDWQVRKVSSEYLLTPQLKKNGKHAFVFPISKLDSQLWLVGEGTGGFCWTAENDANWVSRDREKVLHADTASGKCSVQMITKKVRLPEKIRYTSLFIATPTRPLKLPARFNAFGSGNRYKQAITYTGADKSSAAYTGVFNLRPSKEAWRFWKNVRPKSLRPYNAADSGTVVMPEAVYLKKYGEIPGEYSYNMPYWRVVDAKGKQVLERQPSISFCNKTFISDYLMWNNKILLDSEYGNRIGQLSYDLAQNTLCANPFHGCFFKDRFGRDIKTFVIMSKRKFFERTLRLAHSRGVSFALHAQDRFCPMLHGFGDIWLPGEQHCATYKTNPFALIDGSIEERLFRSEYNRDVIGTGVTMSCALAQLNRKNYDIPEATIAAMTMMLLYDIDFSRGWMAHKEVFRLFDVFKKYDFNSFKVKAHKFYRQKEITSNNCNVLVTWYECPEGEKLIVLGNRTRQPQKAVVDLGKVTGNTGKLREEFYKKDITVSNGKVSVTVPAQAFLLLGTKKSR